MNSDWIESELQDCLSELRSICEHFEPPRSRGQKVKLQWHEWWSDYWWAIWLLLIGGVPMLVSICDNKKSLEPSEFPRDDASAQYSVAYYSDGADEEEQEGEEEVEEEEEEVADDE